MQPREFKQRFAAAVVKRCGICQATVEQVLPAVFDEIRAVLIEGRYPCIPIDSFGTFGVVDYPARQHTYTYKGKSEVRTLPPTKKLKFYPAYNFRKELEAGRFDPTRRSFTRHPHDPIIRKRKAMQYHPNKKGIIYKGPTAKLTRKQTDRLDEHLQCDNNGACQ